MTCSRCTEEAFVKQGHQWLCPRHYRFGQMRSTAKRRGKKVPEHTEIAAMVEACKMICPLCGRSMNWLAKSGHSTVVTLQHDQSGELKLLCLACNVRHRTFAEDSIYTRDRSKHPCRDCGKELAKSDFWTDRSRPLGIKPYCKNCAYERYKKWAENNRERINARQRLSRITN